MDILARIKSTLRGLSQNIKLRIKICIVALDGWFYQKDITKPRIKHSIVIIISFVAFSFSIIFVISMIPTILTILRALIQAIYDFGVLINLSDPSSFVTIIVATLIVGLGQFIFSRISGHERSIQPRILILSGSEHTDTNGVTYYRILVSNRRGSTIALDCQARLTIEDIDRRDVLDISGAKFTTLNFTKTIKTDLLWDDNVKELSIRSGDESEIVYWRYVPARGEVPAHFEVPSCDDNYKSIICLRIKRYYPKVIVVPVNGKYVTADFEPSLAPNQSNEYLISIDD